MRDLTIRAATADDRPAILRLLLPVFRAGDSYAVAPDLEDAEALEYWDAPGKTVFLAEDCDGTALGTYYIRANAGGGGDHVCNCGYVTASAARGRGVARTMLDHSLDVARAAGYRAMQFNFVVSTNTRALEIWDRAGFTVVGRLPRAFRHPDLGFVDALVMWKDLAGGE